MIWYSLAVNNQGSFGFHALPKSTEHAYGIGGVVEDAKAKHYVETVRKVELIRIQHLKFELLGRLLSEAL